MEEGLIFLERCFANCKISPALVNKITGKPTSILPSPIGTWKTTSFFIDSSGRSTFTLPLELTFASKEDLDQFLAAKCLYPSPILNHDVSPRGAESVDDGLCSDEKDNNGAEKDTSDASAFISALTSSRVSMALEVKSYSIDDSNEVAVEGVTITSSSVHDLIIVIHARVTVRATFHESFSLPNSPSGFSATGGTGGDYSDREPRNFNVLTNLEVTPVLAFNQKQKAVARRNACGDEDIPDLVALELAAIPDQMQKSSRDRIHEVRFPSMNFQVTLTHAFTVAVKSSPSPSGNTKMGSTLVSLTIRHANSHMEPVTITNVAIHPGHSRHEMVTQTKSGAPQVQQAVTNMTKSVQWGFAPKTELSLPLTLHPREAYSTILYINAGEEMMSRSFVSPVSVTGIVGSCHNDLSANSKHTVNENHSFSSSSDQCRVVVAGDAHWTTELVAVEPADAFRVQLTVQQPIVQLGEPMHVKFRIFNLSLETRNIMLLIAKDQQQQVASQQLEYAGGAPSTSKSDAVNAAVVSEANGYTFGVWGISGDDDGTVKLNRDFELLAIDNALMLGTLQGQHAVDAELRFVPLRIGRLRVPDWKLYDKGANRWYTCSHNLSIIAVQ